MASGKRLLHVIHSSDPARGGPIEGVRQRARVLEQLGHEVEVATLDAPEACTAEDLKVHALGPGAGGYGYSSRIVRWIEQNAERFDHVVVNGIWQYHSLAAWRALRKLRIPYFVFPHGMLDPWFRDAYPRKHQKKMLYWKLIESRVLRDATAVLFTSEEERLLARKSFRPYEVCERVVRYGTAGPPPNEAAQRDAFLSMRPQLARKRMLLFLSRIHPKKGCDLLIRAFAEVAAQHDLWLVMAGPDQVGWRADLERLARSLDVSDRIVWTGMLTGDAKWGAYRSSEALVLPSHQENFGIVVAEAMACGVPPLISNKVNIWREIEDDGAGLVGEDTQAGASSLLRRWLELNASARAEMSQAARRSFAERFEVGAAARSLIEALEIK